MQKPETQKQESHTHTHRHSDDYSIVAFCKNTAIINIAAGVLKLLTVSQTKINNLN